MAYIYNLSDAWNDAGVTFTAIKMNVTDTASNAASLLMDLQTGGVSRFSVAKGGIVNASQLLVSGSYGGDGNWWSPNFLGIAGGSAIIFGADVQFRRDGAANTLAQRNGTNAQTFRVYNTFTDASNYERGFFRYVSNQLEIGHEAAGTGSASREVKIVGIAVKAGTAANPADTFYSSSTLFGLPSGSVLAWASNNTNAGTSSDTSLVREAAGVLGVRAASAANGGALSFIEQTAPAAPATNGVRIYAEDNGSGKTRLMARFATGAAVQIAIEP
jgi:hypothetical protein